MTPDPGLSPYWPGPWPAEDGGPRRLQSPGAGATLPAVTAASGIDVLSRTDPLITMAITREPGEVFLLRHTTQSIKEISAACGFSRPNYFLQVFHRLQGTTPFRYRRALDNQATDAIRPRGPSGDRRKR